MTEVTNHEFTSPNTIAKPRITTGNPNPQGSLVGFCGPREPLEPHAHRHAVSRWQRPHSDRHPLGGRHPGKSLFDDPLNIETVSRPLRIRITSRTHPVSQFLTRDTTWRRIHWWWDPTMAAAASVNPKRSRASDDRSTRSSPESIRSPSAVRRYPSPGRDNSSSRRGS